MPSLGSELRRIICWFRRFLRVINLFHALFWECLIGDRHEYAWWKRTAYSEGLRQRLTWFQNDHKVGHMNLLQRPWGYPYLDGRSLLLMHRGIRSVSWTMYPGRRSVAQMRLSNRHPKACSKAVCPLHFNNFAPFWFSNHFSISFLPYIFLGSLTFILSSNS